MAPKSAQAEKREEFIVVAVERIHLIALLYGLGFALSHSISLSLSLAAATATNQVA